MKPISDEEAQRRIELHRKRSEDCMEVLHRLAMDPMVNHKHRIAAAAAYLERGNSGVRRVPGLVGNLE